MACIYCTSCVYYYCSTSTKALGYYILHIHSTQNRIHLQNTFPLSFGWWDLVANSIYFDIAQWCQFHLHALGLGFFINTFSLCFQFLAPCLLYKGSSFAVQPYTLRTKFQPQHFEDRKVIWCFNCTIQRTTSNKELTENKMFQILSIKKERELSQNAVHLY